MTPVLEKPIHGPAIRIIKMVKSKLEEIIQEELENILKEFPVPSTSTTDEHGNPIDVLAGMPTEDELNAAESIY